MREISEGNKKYALNRDKAITRDFPEYEKFDTGTVEYRTARICNAPGDQTIEVLDKVYEGKLGDVLEVYVGLLLEKKKDTFWHDFLRPFRFDCKRMSYDRDYIIKQLQRALNGSMVRW
jgi:hypothetical protein